MTEECKKHKQGKLEHFTVYLQAMGARERKEKHLEAALCSRFGHLIVSHYLS